METTEMMDMLIDHMEGMGNDDILDLAQRLVREKMEGMDPKDISAFAKNILGLNIPKVGNKKMIAMGDTDPQKILDDIHLKAIEGDSLAGEKARILAEAYSDSRAENRNLAQLVSYFGSVLVASAEELFCRKSTSKTERERQISICSTVLASLKAKALVGKPSGNNMHDVVRRTEKAIRLAETGKFE